MAEITDIMSLLESITEDDVERFTLDGMAALAKVVSVYDGDTCDVVFYHEKYEDVLRFKCRLSSVDAPELDEPNGKLTRDYLAHLCMGEDPKDFDDSAVWDEEDLQQRLNESKNIVCVVFGENDKYGRPLVLLKTLTSSDDDSINDSVSNFIENLSD